MATKKNDESWMGMLLEEDIKALEERFSLNRNMLSLDMIKKEKVRSGPTVQTCKCSGCMKFRVALIRLGLMDVKYLVNSLSLSEEED